MFYKTSLRFLALSLLAVGCLSAVPDASAQETVCEGFDKKQRIGKLGGRTAFYKGPIASPADLRDQLEEHRTEVEAIMVEKGVGHLTDALYAAVASGNGLSERKLERGEVFEWMTFRKRSGATTLGPMCFSARKEYWGYEIQVTETVDDNFPPVAKCALTASGGACVEDPVMVNAGGSSKGVNVEMNGPGGAKSSIISGGKTDWSGKVNAGGKYTFTANAEETGTRKVTTYTFMVPKACLNLAYIGSEEKTKTETDTCSETATVDVADCQVSLNVTAEPIEVKRGEDIQVDISGTYDSAKVTFEKDGAAVDAKSGEEMISELTESGTISFRKTGTYQLKGSAVSCEGKDKAGNDWPKVCTKNATAETTVTVKPAWTARFFGLALDPDDITLAQDRIRPDGASERSVLTLDKGQGVGAGLEYHFNDRVGLEASILYAVLDSKLFFDIGSDWAEGNADADLLSVVIGPNFHLTPGKKVDLYIGPFIGFADLGDVSFNVLGETQRRDFDTDTVIGAQLGLDVPFGAGDWAAHFGARYMDLSAEVNGVDIDIDPLGVEVGLAYKF